MTKTIWVINDKTDNIVTELTYYHFGNKPQFPTWYMEDHTYEIEMSWNLKLVWNIKIFLKCLTHCYGVR